MEEWEEQVVRSSIYLYLIKRKGSKIEGNLIVWSLDIQSSQNSFKLLDSDISAHKIAK